ncbi:MAG: hypothetical protein QG632_411 [Candidatus Dependentiae bacterium]|nr:hypothetical protein [Candidatus Dependentiae bacterium]
MGQLVGVFIVIGAFILYLFVGSMRDRDTEISNQRLRHLIQSGPVLLIDVRESYEHEEGFIDGSILLPSGQIKGEMIPTGDEPIVLYCRSGYRSMRALELVRRYVGSRPCYSLSGGIIAWQQAGFPVVKRANKY